MYQYPLCLKPNLTMCLFTTSKGIKIGQPSQEKSGVSKLRGTVNHPVVSSSHIRPMFFIPYLDSCNSHLHHPRGSCSSHIQANQHIRSRHRSRPLLPRMTLLWCSNHHSPPVARRGQILVCMVNLNEINNTSVKNSYSPCIKTTY